MRLNELTGYKNHPLYKSMKNLKPKPKPGMGTVGSSDEDKDLIAEFSKIGWDFLGFGSFGMVFGDNTKPYVLKVFKNDERYLEYFNRIKKFKGNPFIPKIYGMGKAHEINPDIHVVRVEKLQPIRDGDPIFSKYIDPAFRDELSKYGMSGVLDEDNQEFLSQNYPELEHILNSVNTDDLENPQNVMRRGDTIVITDP